MSIVQSGFQRSLSGLVWVRFGLIRLWLGPNPFRGIQRTHVALRKHVLQVLRVYFSQQQAVFRRAPQIRYALEVADVMLVQIQISHGPRLRVLLLHK